MTSTHPRTSTLSDARLPEVSTLLGERQPAPLLGLFEELGGTLHNARANTVSWWPGRSIAVTYQVDVEGGPLPGSHEVVAVAGKIPGGALIVSSGQEQVGVWRIPNDPALPGLPLALAQETAGALVAELGGAPGKVSTRLRAYRPTRRAVVEVSLGNSRCFLKVLRPEKAVLLHEIHRAHAGDLPVPRSLGFDPESGITAIEALPGHTLRQALDRVGVDLPDPRNIVSLVADLPFPKVNRAVTSPIGRLPDVAELLSLLVPDQQGRIDDALGRIGEETEQPDTPSHGDFYESQVIVDGSGVVGMIDIDTMGWGRPGDDPATMLGHLSVWATLARQPDRVVAYGNDLLKIWDSLVDPVDLRRRTAAVILALSVGPFRVQQVDWPGQVVARLELAERWLDSAEIVDEKSLIAGSGSPHGAH